MGYKTPSHYIDLLSSPIKITYPPVVHIAHDIVIMVAESFGVMRKKRSICEAAWLQDSKSLEASCTLGWSRYNYRFCTQYELPLQSGLRKNRAKAYRMQNDIGRRPCH